MFWLIGVIIGWFGTKSFWGSLFGYMIGSAIDRIRSQGKPNPFSQQNQRQSGRTAQDIYEHYQRRAQQSQDMQSILMAFSAAVMKADGKVLKVELNYVKSFFHQQFGPRFTPEHLQVLKDYLDKDIPLSQICQDMRYQTTLEVRMQIVHYLFGIAKSDNSVSSAEMTVISNIAMMLGIPQREFESLMNMNVRNTDSDYKVLGIDANASDDEVKKAYRDMAKKFHPDRVAQMGEEHQKSANEKFQKIQEAYEAIKKKRGFK